MSDPNQPEKAVVTVHGARELYDTNILSRMDPYCIVTLGGQEYKTNVDTKGSKTPKWDQTFTFSYVGETTMRFKVMDKDKFTSDDYVGLADVSLGPIIHGTRKYLTELQLSRKEGKTAGFLKVSIEFFPKKEEKKDSSSASAPAAAAVPAAAPAAAPVPAYAPPPAYQQYPYGYTAAPPPAAPGYPPNPYGYPAPAPAPGYGAYQQAPPYGAAYPGYAPHAQGQKKKKKKSKKKKSSSSSSSSDSD